MDIEMWSGVDSYWWMPRPARVRVPCDSPRHRCRTWLCLWCVAGDVGSFQTLDHRHCTASLYGSEGHAAESPGGPCSCWGACHNNAAPARCIREWHHCRCYWQISHHSQHHHSIIRNSWQSFHVNEFSTFSWKKNLLNFTYKRRIF